MQMFIEHVIFVAFAIVCAQGIQCSSEFSLPGCATPQLFLWCRQVVRMNKQPHKYWGIPKCRGTISPAEKSSLPRSANPGPTWRILRGQQPRFWVSPKQPGTTTQGLNPILLLSTSTGPSCVHVVGILLDLSPLSPSYTFSNSFCTRMPKLDARRITLQCSRSKWYL